MTDKNRCNVCGTEYYGMPMYIKCCGSDPAKIVTLGGFDEPDESPTIQSDKPDNGPVVYPRGQLLVNILSGQKFRVDSVHVSELTPTQVHLVSVDTGVCRPYSVHAVERNFKLVEG